ncbi:hypothetical protein RJ640_030669 [Escallonia rubra]|uniref:DDE Tnp4 domain-containing protein n=1 Tax=Escallonia rubra TaxID=112253 RepID=A0AA88UJU5_9ASTE|nr:hypothetical protein RJ640_030669 [Escallonia rubra]
MRPIGSLKKRKKAEKEEDDHNAPLPCLQPQPEPLDWWVHFSKRIAGPLSKSNDSARFESVFKISRRTFKYICSLVKVEMMTKPSKCTDLKGKLLCLNDRVAVALRRLSSGDSLVAVGDSFGINRTTVGQITWRFVEAMEERALHHLHWPSAEEMRDIKCKFEENQGLPNCCGAIDTTHILMSLSTADPSRNIWRDSEKHHSMLLQAIVDPEMRFRDIVTGWPGSATDSLVLENSSFFKLSEEGKRLDGTKIQVTEGRELRELREYIVGDVGFPLLPWLFTPYQGKELPEYQANFNKRHFATQMVAQMALARLKERWKIIDGLMWRPDKNRLPRIIFVCCLLHNILINLEDEMQDGLPFSRHHDPDYSQQACDSDDKIAASLREKLSLYLSERFPP